MGIGENGEDLWDRKNLIHRRKSRKHNLWKTTSLRRCW